MKTIPDQFKISAASIEALNKLRSKKEIQIQEQNLLKKIDYSKFVFEEYNEEDFETKIRADSTYYNIFVKRLTPDSEKDIEKIIGNMLQYVREIYEYINIKPKIYGFNTIEIINGSENVLEKKATQFITDYINRNYYTLSKAQLESRYMERINPIAKDMVLNENIDPEEAVKFSIKAVVLENLLEKISFPLLVKDRISDLMKKSDMFFDSTGLNILWNNYKDVSNEIAKIIAAVV